MKQIARYLYRFNGSVNVLSTSKMKTIFLFTLDFAAESTRCRGMISRLQ